MNTYRILIADDHTVIRIGLKYILNTQFNCQQIEEAECAKDLFELLEKKTFTHLVLDLQLPDTNMLSAFPTLRSQYPELKILVYSMSDEEIFARRLLLMGANGYLSKLSNGSEVRKALNLFLMGRNYTSDVVKTALKKLHESSESNLNPFDELSEREMEVAIDLLQGKRVKEIATRLKLRSSTITTYKARIFEKAGVRTLLDFRNIAQYCNLIEA